MTEAGVTRRFNARIPLRDGITLSADLTLPATLPAPAVVTRTPYGKAGERQSRRGTINCFASAGFLGRSQRLAYALGYAGHGVGPSHLVGRIVRDLLLGSGSDLLDLPMVSKRPVPLPPGPLRGGMLGLAERVLQRADDQGSDASPLVRLALRILQ